MFFISLAIAIEVILLVMTRQIILYKNLIMLEPWNFEKIMSHLEEANFLRGRREEMQSYIKLKVLCNREWRDCIVE